MESNYNKLPNFFIIGAAKSGTSSIFSYLRQHPQIYMPSEKETHFFRNESKFQRGTSYYINKYYRGSEGIPFRGDASPSYLHRYDVVIPRLKSVYGERPIKFIICLRDPVERAFSHYLHAVASAREHETFERALELEEARRQEMPGAWVHYASDGFYDDQLNAWLSAFPRSQFHVLLTEALAKNPKEEIAKVLFFLGADMNSEIDTSGRWNPSKRARSRTLSSLYKPDHPLRRLLALMPDEMRPWLRKAIRRANFTSSTAYPPMMPQTRERLRSLFEPHNRALAAMLDIDLSVWQ